MTLGASWCSVLIRANRKEQFCSQYRTNAGKKKPEVEKGPLYKDHLEIQKIEGLTETMERRSALELTVSRTRSVTSAPNRSICQMNMSAATASPPLWLLLERRSFWKTLSTPATSIAISKILMPRLNRSGRRQNRKKEGGQKNSHR